MGIHAFYDIGVLLGHTETAICLSVSSHAQGISVKIAHVFSVEMDERKRNWIQREHSPQHLFDNVEVFKDLRGYCYQCKAHHDINRTNCGHDLLVAGPSCKDNSRLKNTTLRKKQVGCYNRSEEDVQSGTSGPTYLFGFKKVPWLIYIYICIHTRPHCFKKCVT